jgi:hypothetical protein
MICKECGAYNPDHATFCKVCAASLKPDAAPKASEEQPQPTKRFSRPSWIAPEQSETEDDQAVKAAKPAENAAEPVEVEEAAEEVQETIDLNDHEEDTPAPVWTPSRVRRKPQPVVPEETDDEEDDDSGEDDEEEQESIYNDEEALEDDEDSFEYEPTPPKRKQQKKKNNTLFTVLLIAIIVVIVGILVAVGYGLLNKQLNCGNASDQRGNEAQTVNQPGDEPGTPAQNPTATEAPALDSRTAQLQEVFDNNTDMIAITIVVPSNSTVTIDFPNQDDYSFTNTEGKDVTRKVKIPAEVFYPGRPLTESESEIEFHPDITITQADGSSYKVNCPSFKRSFPKLTFSITEPVTQGDEPFMAPVSNQVHIEGMIDNWESSMRPDAYINNVLTTVYDGGHFVYDYKFADTATEDTVDTLTISVKLANYVCMEKELKLHAYKYIPDPMVLEVRSEGSSLHADKNGKLTVTGTTLPGATLTATSDNTTNVLCGSITVDAEGNFSLPITMEESFYGMSVITLNAEKEGAENGSVKFTVTRGFADKTAFVKFYAAKHNYLEIPSKIKIDELLANIQQYANNEYGFRITATVVEVITIDGDTIVKMTMNKTNETVYVHNLSDRWTPGDNIGAKYNIYGNFVGTYTDTGCCEFYGWFAKKP